jgi:hypothetical protein
LWPFGRNDKDAHFNHNSHKSGVSPEGYLKKQSQFSKGQNDVNAVFIMVYGDLDGPGHRKNKANSKPIVFSPQIFRGLKKQSQFAGVLN